MQHEHFNISGSNVSDVVCSGLECNSGLIADLESVLGYVVPAIFALLAVVGFCSNFLVLLVVICNRSLRSTTNIFMANLALADLLFIVICLPFNVITYSSNEWPFPHIWCHFISYTMHVAASASIFTLVAISVDRFIAITQPLKALVFRTTRYTSLILGITWSAAILINLPAFMEYDFPRDTSQKLHNRCDDINLAQVGTAEKIFEFVFFSFSYIIPLAFMIVLYAMTIRQMNRKSSVTEHQASALKKSLSIVRRRQTRLLIVVTCAFALCWLPIHLLFLINVQVLIHYDLHGRLSLQLCHLAARLLAYTNSCANPFLYAFLFVRVRKACWDLSFGRFARCSGRS